jgi:hypothetical protein
MGGERAVQKLVEGKPGGRGDRGRSSLSSMGHVDLELSGIWVYRDE